MSTKLCEVCNDVVSKYKCPHCELRYCSIKCFKDHKPVHDTKDNDSTGSKAAIKTEDDSQIQTATGQAGKREIAAVNPLTALQEHPQFQPLFKSYPQLKSQLQRIHQATQNPYQPGLDANGETLPRSKIRDRVPGQWTQDKADDMAAKLLVDLQKQDDGVREFMALVNQVFQKDATKQGKEAG